MSKNLIVEPGGKLTQDATEDALTQKFQTEMGQKAIVQRQVIEEDHLKEQFRLVLDDLGRDIQRLGDIPKGMEYCGSAAVHIFRAPTLGIVAYYNQLNLSNCPEQLAGPAVSDLRGSMLENYGHRRQKKRSGF